MHTARRFAILATILTLFVLGGCSNDSSDGSPTTTPPPASSTYTIGGNVAGLSSGAKLTLEDNGTDGLTVSANGEFTFSTALSGGATYAVTISTPPTGETCTLSSPSGTVGSADVTSVAITCTVSATPSYRVGGTVSGLTGSTQVTLELNGGASLAVSDGSFNFTATLKSGRRLSGV